MFINTAPETLAFAPRIFVFQSIHLPSIKATATRLIEGCGYLSYHHFMIDVKGHFFTSNPERQRMSQLTPDKLRYLEDTTDLVPGSKVELLSIFTHYKWIGELDIRNERTDHDQSQITALAELGLPWRSNSYARQNDDKVYWIQVGINEAILDYVEKYRDEIDSLVAGVLYGYPLTSVLAFTDVIDTERSNERDLIYERSASRFYLSGVLSAQFAQRERDYFNGVWESLKYVSPKIIAEAESYFNYWQKEWDARDKSRSFSDQECYKRWGEESY